MITLPKTIDLIEAQRRILDPNWALQQKYDGERVIVICKGGEIEAVNKKGRQFTKDDEILPFFAKDVGDYVLDCEYAWGIVWAFDELSKPEAPYLVRLRRAATVVQELGGPRVRRVRTWRDPAKKAAMFERAREQGIEGVIFRSLRSPHYPGSDSNVCCRFKFR